MPEGRYVADGNGMRPWDENTAAELALTGMLLSQGAKRARAMLDAARQRRRPESNRCRRLCSAPGSHVLRLPTRFLGTSGAFRRPQKTLKWAAWWAALTWALRGVADG
jgi:hypothetical protein